MAFGKEVLDRARDLGLARCDTIEFQWRRFYRLAPTDPRYLAMSREDLLIDYWAIRHAEDPKLRDEIVSDHFEEDLEEMFSDRYDR